MLLVYPISAIECHHLADFDDERSSELLDMWASVKGWSRGSWAACHYIVELSNQ